jgi:hypothetical protein
VVCPLAGDEKGAFCLWPHNSGPITLKPKQILVTTAKQKKALYTIEVGYITDNYGTKVRETDWVRIAEFLMNNSLVADNIEDFKPGPAL